jgi:hypothetical protein
MNALLYILNKEGAPMAIAHDSQENVLTWGRFMEDPRNKIVARSRGNGLIVSTVFLGVDHGWGEEVPILWETMVFREPPDDQSMSELDCERCAGTREQAEAQHERVCARLGIDP